MKSSKVVFSILLCAFLLFSCSQPPQRPSSLSLRDYSYTKQYISYLAQQEMKKHEIKGLSIALIDDQKVVWAEGFGYADEFNKIPATKETVYQVGSISKLFTAAAVMQLYERGKLDIDAPIQTYVPQFSIKSRLPDTGRITPRNIMTHHSGLPQNRHKGMWNPNLQPFSQVIPGLTDEYTSFPSNNVMAYSNLAVSILGHAVENITGRDFPSYMKEEILLPMGMTDSSFLLNPAFSQLLSKGYLNGKEMILVPLRDLPSGGLYSNVHDLSRLIMMVFAGGKSDGRTILRSETLAEMFRPQNANVPLDFDFRIGLGWFLSGLDIRNAGSIAWHNGGTMLFHSQLIVLPQHKLGVVVLANSSTAREAVDKIALEALKLALEEKTGVAQSGLEKEEHISTAVGIPEKTLREFEGTYATSLMSLLVVQAKGESLKADFRGKTLYLIPQSDNTFTVEYKLLGLIPLSLKELKDLRVAFRTVNNHKLALVRRYGEWFLLGDKIDPYPVSENWRGRSGCYDFINLDGDTPNFNNLKIRYENGLLLIDFKIPFWGLKGEYAIRPVSDTEAVILGLGTGMGETIKVISVDGRENLLYSGYIMRKKTGK